MIDLIFNRTPKIKPMPERLDNNERFNKCPKLKGTFNFQIINMYFFNTL